MTKSIGLAAIFVPNLAIATVGPKILESPWPFLVYDSGPLTRTHVLAEDFLTSVIGFGLGCVIDWSGSRQHQDGYGGLHTALLRSSAYSAGAVSASALLRHRNPTRIDP